MSLETDNEYLVNDAKSPKGSLLSKDVPYRNET